MHAVIWQRSLPAVVEPILYYRSCSFCLYLLGYPSMPFNKSRADSDVTETANDDVEDSSPKGMVAKRYMGTVADQRDMSALGRVQVLRVSSEVRRPLIGFCLTLASGIFDSFLSLGLGAR